MTKWVKGDEERTKAVILGEQPATENGKTWLRHSKSIKDGSCYRIDLAILEGSSTVEEIARSVGCPMSRVKSHLDHLQEKKDSKMEPHHLKIKIINENVMFDHGA
jgi:hypothetical protein